MLEILNDFLETDFEKDLFKEVLNNLNCQNSKIRHCNFAYALRSLIDFIFENRLSPKDKIINATWYKKESECYEVTRRQRYKYFIQGTIDDYFITEILKYKDINEIAQNLNKKVHSLSKFTHIQEKVFYASDEKIENFVNEIEQAITEFFEEIETIKEELLEKLKLWLWEVVNDEFISETIEDVDELCTHYYVDYADVEDIEILNLNNKSLFLDITNGINIEVCGTLNIEHQFGSDGDLKRGDGWQFDASYPYSMEFYISIPKIKDIIDDEEEYELIENYSKEEKEELNKTFLRVFYDNIKRINYNVDTSSHFE